MTTLVDVLSTQPSEEVAAKKRILLQQLMEQREGFDLNQDIIFASGYRCKPLHLFLAENDPLTIPIILTTLRMHFASDRLREALGNYTDSYGKACTAYVIGAEIGSTAKQLMEYAFNPSYEEIFFRGVYHHGATISTPGTGGMFAKKAPIASHEEGLLRLGEFRDTPALGVTPEQLDQVMHYDSQCCSLYQARDRAVSIHPSIKITDFATKFDAVITEQLATFTAITGLKMMISPIFIYIQGYELLLTTMRKEDGGIAMTVTEIMGKEGSKLQEMDKFFVGKGIEYHHNIRPIVATFKGHKIYSCCGTMMNLIFKVVDDYHTNADGVDVAQTNATLTATTAVELSGTIERANRAIGLALKAENLAPTKPPPI
ncbi:hypothetical protein [Legionella fallonii]|uniref:Uncharacterized protein n=1 Tax=Legionella fallonii LLAP-10 TaxID=1212491 RepID=A0A098G9V3_9GAMM|nr:hypothetical protein [Legionella fallonii]CEG58785.1 protein of unknown function [Legionella fallonii LLAP-10]